MAAMFSALRQNPWMALIVLGCLIGVFAPRIMATLLPVAMLAATVRLIAVPSVGRTGGPPQTWFAKQGPAGRRALAFVGAFVIWALASALWSGAPGHSIGKAAYLGMLLAGLLAVAVWRESESHDTVERVAIGLLLGVCFISVIMAIDVMTNQGLVRWFMTKFPFLRGESTKHIFASDGVVYAQSEAEINRRTTVMTLLLWPAGLIAANLWRSRLQATVGGIARTAFIPAVGLSFLAALMAIAFGGHQSSQTAIAAGIVTFLAAFCMPRLALPAAATVWVVLTVLIVPIVLTAQAARLQEAPWLFHSAKHRVVIWNRTVQRIGLKPWIGIGADATPAAKEFADEPDVKVAGFPVSTGRHAHNAYLQVWYELGGVGALLLLAAGLAVLGLIATLPPVLVPWALAQAATTAIMAASSFSIWQVWFLASIGAGAAVLVIANGPEHLRPAPLPSSK